MKDYSHFADIQADKPVPLQEMPLEQLEGMLADLKTRLTEALKGGTFLEFEFPPDPVAEAFLLKEIEKFSQALERRKNQ